MTTTKLAPLITRYARRLHERAEGAHHVASPLGAWLLIAMCAPLADGSLRRQLGEVLGADPDAAAELASELVSDPHPVVGCAAALWTLPEVDSGELRAWRKGLPAAVETGDIPDQAALDTWAREHTLGLIEHFPVDIDPSYVLVMANALATRVSWARPFDLVSASALGTASRWSTELETVLHSPGGDFRHLAFIADTTAAGMVAVHTALARDGLQVTSVIGSPDRQAAEVLAAAYEIAVAQALEPETVAHRSLFDLPAGDGTFFFITEEPTETSSPDGREQRCRAAIPAWSAHSDHDLDHPSLGFPAAAAAFAEVLRLHDYDYVSRQAAMARYGRYGFEAAAVTALGMWLSADPARRPGIRRVAELRFGHPFAVVAVALNSRDTKSRHRANSPWHGLPVFAAWVTEPEEPEHEEPD